jgi:hypothetical protein
LNHLKLPCFDLGKDFGDFASLGEEDNIYAGIEHTRWDEIPLLAKAPIRRLAFCLQILFILVNSNRNIGHTDDDCYNRTGGEDLHEFDYGRRIIEQL